MSVGTGQKPNKNGATVRFAPSPAMIPSPVTPIAADGEEEEEELVTQGETGSALYDFLADGEDELSVKEGEQLFILDRVSSDEWWKCRNVHGAEGVVPSSYIEVRPNCFEIVSQLSVHTQAVDGLVAPPDDTQQRDRLAVGESEREEAEREEAEQEEAEREEAEREEAEREEAERAAAKAEAAAVKARERAERDRERRKQDADRKAAAAAAAKAEKEHKDRETREREEHAARERDAARRRHAEATK